MENEVIDMFDNFEEELRRAEMKRKEGEPMLQFPESQFDEGVPIAQDDGVAETQNVVPETQFDIENANLEDQYNVVGRIGIDGEVELPEISSDDVELTHSDEEYDEGEHKDQQIGDQCFVHNPRIPWNMMEPHLGEKYEIPEQLKLCLTNYAVANGYQLRFPKCDSSRILVRCAKKMMRISVHLDVGHIGWEMN
ncbi:unnamed protein product [Lactuca saligna]|uniref:Transposase MuDR plant domain-containing protein n=1 Tax=Lactuca saligna TaxID=75948 RepID=A0AA36EK48_LACSI|nr:unnamed protein product [Lactuca saligna]